MRSKVQRWRGVAGKFTIECGLTDTGPCDVHEHPLPLALAPLLSLDDCHELVIEFASSGYNDPGCIYGDPGNCYPPEGDDERTVTGMTLGGEPVPKELWGELETMYADEIADVEIDWRD